MLPLFLLSCLLQSPDRDALILGVDSLIAPSALPGAVVASKSAFVVMRTADSPTLVAGPVGAGRAMISGHGGFFSVEALKNPSNAHLFANSLAWLGHRQVAGLSIGLLESDDVAAAANGLGAVVVNLTRTGLASKLARVDILLMGQGALDGDKADQSVVLSWIKAGHGLYTAGPGWGWQQLNPGKSIRTDLAANAILLPYGLGLSGDIADGTPKSEGAADPLFQTETALAALRKGGLTPSESARATGTVSRSLALASLNDPELVATIGRLAAEEGPERFPLTKAKPFSRLNAVLLFRKWEEEPPHQVTADPSAEDFPGPVPASAKPVTRMTEIDTSIPDWHGLGLYAPPGRIIKVIIPASAARKGIGIRIGSHTDTLWDTEKWDRFPEISRRWPLDSTATEIASPFGGTMYIDVPQNCSLGVIPVRVSGAVHAVRYVRGVTTKAEWNKMRSEPAGPWAELEAHQIILSVPHSAIEHLEDPEPLMAYWDHVADLCYRLYAAPRHPRPERYCVDRQISVGYMHAGYPIMTFEDVANTFTNIQKLTSKDYPWGFYHELGHNFQQEAWTFDGTGEVTNNLFSLYACQYINGIDHPGDMAIDKRNKKIKSYLAAGAHFADWKSDPFLALSMYDQIRQEFGWEPFTRVFATYRKLNLNPQGEIAQHDEWMTQMSRSIGRNLGPFFTAWGVPTSEAARRETARLPEWMPSDWRASFP